MADPVKVLRLPSFCTRNVAMGLNSSKQYANIRHAVYIMRVAIGMHYSVRLGCLPVQYYS